MTRHKSSAKSYTGIDGFQVTDVTSHRNGVGGRRFYSVRFSYREGDRFMPNMLAVMPDDAKMGCDTECFVLDLNDPTANWRGDNYATQVKAAIDTHTREGEAAYESIRQLSAARR